jgi:hypothetical protein
VHLVGGAGQIPLLGNLLGTAFDVRIGLDEAPQSVVALGGHTLSETGTDQPVTTEPVDVGTGYREPLPTGPVGVTRPAGDAARPGVPARRSSWVAVAAATVAVLAATTAVALGGERAVAGQARAAVTVAEPLSVSPPVAGDPITVPGQSTQDLPVTEKGVPVRYESSGATMTWQLDSFIDTPEQSEELAEAGVRVDEEHRLVLARITVGAVDKTMSPSEVEADTYVVDDRGLMVTAAENFRLAGCPERAGEELDAGEQRQTCLAFRVGATAPVTEVVLAGISTYWPKVSAPEQLTQGARVRVTGQRVDGSARPVPDGALPLLAPHTFRTDSAAADVAVADLVQAPSRYFDSEPIGLPGSRGVLVRLAVRPETDKVPSLYVQLRDDRGTGVDSAASAIVTAHGCTAEHELGKSTDVQLFCVLFAVPTATPVRDVEVSAYGNDPMVWAAS